MSEADDIKKDILGRYRNIESALDQCLQRVNDLRFANDEFTQLKQGLVDVLSQLVAKLRQEVEANIRNMRWDKLVIAFFGETGAGKSTIIETFRILTDDPLRKENDDGLIVGEGDHDYTKEAHEYELSIHGRPFVLVDVPGIEGDEAKYRDIIYDALSKAHIVFYVQGNNKMPDEATAAKIKDYLGDWSRVYSIQNVSGSAGDYDEAEDRDTLLKPDVLKIEREMEVRFRQVLGDVYEGNIPLQALLAMSAKASFSPTRTRLVRGQAKLLRFFKSAENVLRFSQFQTLMNLVEEKADSFASEIERSNLRKLQGFAMRVDGAIDAVFAQHEDVAGTKLKLLKEFRRTANAQLSNLPLVVDSQLASKLRTQYDSVKARTYSEIDSKDKKKDKKRKIRAMVNALPATLTDKLNETAHDQTDLVMNQLKRQAEKIKGVDFIGSLVFDFSLNIPIDTDILEDGLAELDANLEDAGDIAMLAATGAGCGVGWGPPGMLICGAVGGLVGLGKKYYFDRKKKKASAKESIGIMLGKSRQDAQASLKRESASLQSKLNKMKATLLRQVDQEAGAVEEIQDIADELRNSVAASV